MVQVYKDVTEMEAEIVTIDDAIKAVQTAQYGTDMRVAIKRGFEIITASVVTKDDIEDSLKKFSDTLDDRLDKMDDRIKHIILGTDDESIRIVVDKILEEKGIE